MISFLVAGISLLLFPEWPVAGAVGLAVAFRLAELWQPASGEAAELIVFYGALGGVATFFIA